VATLEVTWTGTYQASVHVRHFVGTAGQVIDDQSLLQRLSLTAPAGEPGGWLLGPPSTGDLGVLQRPIAALLDAVRDGSPPPGGVEDAVQNLRAGLAFYEAAREGRTVVL
jgi:predicted dehydrogenase